MERARLTRGKSGKVAKIVVTEADLREIGGNGLRGGEDLAGLAAVLNNVHSMSQAQRVFRDADRILRTHGVEAMYAEDTDDLVGIFLNTGDLYSLTLVFDGKPIGQVKVTTQGDWREQMEREGVALKFAAHRAVASVEFQDKQAAGGLYGFTKAIQADCEVATRKLSKIALRLAKQAYEKDQEVVPFLSTHVKRGRSSSARVLLAAMRELGPKVGSEVIIVREAAQAEYGLYGFKAKTADLGLDSCREIKAAAGRISAELHRRRAEMHEKITGFLKEHSKQGRCAYSGMLYSCYPDASTKIASVAPPESVAGWLTWED